MTGVANNHAWVRNGVAKMKSFLNVPRPASNMPTEKEIVVISKMSAGNQRRCMPTGILNQISMPAKMMPDMKKSNRVAATEAKGNTSRGKAIFLITSAFVVILGPHAATALVKKVQGTRPAKLKRM